ncbi:hypothetical protein J6590_024700 [Homalodisca vitripennis]|nr:hypothetical protein J6590_024700 [Homalodisca vitripennis]
MPGKGGANICKSHKSLTIHTSTSVEDRIIKPSHALAAISPYTYVSCEASAVLLA